MKKAIVFSLSVLAVLFVITGCSLVKKSEVQKITAVSTDQIKTKTEQFINDNLMAQGSKATIEKVEEADGLYKLTVNIGNDQKVESYITKDGKTFFPEAIIIKEAEKKTAAANKPAEITEVTKKNAKPEVELFVMSYCPYGTQIEKGMLPVLETLGNKIDFKLKFCDYAMHEKKELDENLIQYCIQKEEPTKLSAYLTCFLEDGKSDECLKTAKVSATKLKACVKATDTKYKVTSNYEKKVGWQGNFPGFDVNKEDNAKYGVQGSPTLIINGENISSGRDASSLLKTICSAFTTQPAECSKQLSAEAPAPGFGFSNNGTNINASCGN